MEKVCAAGLADLCATVLRYIIHDATEDSLSDTGFL